MLVPSWYFTDSSPHDFTDMVHFSLSLDQSEGCTVCFEDASLFKMLGRLPLRDKGLTWHQSLPYPSHLDFLNLMEFFIKHYKMCVQQRHHRASEGPLQAGWLANNSRVFPDSRTGLDWVWDIDNQGGTLGIEVPTLDTPQSMYVCERETCGVRLVPADWQGLLHDPGKEEARTASGLSPNGTPHRQTGVRNTPKKPQPPTKTNHESI